MRIIAGRNRGMRLLSPKTQDSRPITDRVKESLFNVLCKYDLPGEAVVGDLFCGVGSLGLEALSRGAEFVTFVEQDPEIIAVLEKNIDKARFVRESKVIRADAFKLGSPVGTDLRKHNMVFVDPPYAQTSDVGAGSRLSGLMDVLGEQVIKGGIVVVRTQQSVSLLDEYGRFSAIERRRWGSMAVTILRERDE